MSFEVKVDATNPGQFFACCGLFELAARVDASARARFARDSFEVVTTPLTLSAVLTAWLAAEHRALDPEDNTASPMFVGAPFSLRLDWWKDDVTGGRDLKVWAGTMESGRIVRAMMAVLREPSLHTQRIFDEGRVVYDPDQPTKKVEPFCFDARRAPNAHSRDIGFSPNDLGLTSTAHPAVEALCLVGLQRFRPALTPERRVFEYRTWSRALSVDVASAVVSSAAASASATTYRFEAWFRTGQRKHKAFRTAVPVRKGD